MQNAGDNRQAMIGQDYGARKRATSREAETVDSQLQAAAKTHPASKGIARAVGALFLAAMVAYGVGSGLVTTILNAPDGLAGVSAHRTQVALGGLLMLANSAIVTAIGVLLLPVLRQHHEGIAFGYLAARSVEATLLAVGVLFLLLQLPLGDEYLRAGAADTASLQALGTLLTQANDVAYQIAMIALGLGSVLLCALLSRTRLVPRLLALWGVGGYAIFLCGSVLELLGVGVGLYLAIPGGLFELCFGIWLMVKGFGAAGPGRSW